MPILSRTGLTSTVAIDATGQLVARRGYEEGPVTDLNSKWLTRGEALALLAASGAAAATGSIASWVVKARIVAPVANPSDMPAIFWQRVHLPFGMTLKKYQFGRRSLGTAVEGGLWLSVFPEIAGALGSAIPTSMAAVISHDGLPEGCNNLYCGEGVDFDAHVLAPLPAGNVWIACCVDTYSGDGIATPDIDFLDGGEIGKGHAGYKAAVGFAGFADIADAPDTSCSQVPAIYLVAEG